MTYFELLILAVSLTFDTFAVSVSGGISLPANVKMPRKAAIIAFFGFFQAAYLLAGWFVGGKFANFIVEWDHWVAFGILAYLGGKMLFGAIGKKGVNCSEEVEKPDFLSWKRLAFLATATSIDAVAVGASMALLQIEVSRIFVLGGAVMVKVNGKELDIAGKTVSEYLATTNYDPKRIAVERNGDIVFKSQYDITVLKAGDSLEIVSFVGGG